MSWRWLVLGLVLVAALAVAVRLVRGSAAEVPTAVVTAGPFVVRVEAEGALQAVRALPLSLPPTAKGAMRIAWLAPDGAPVAAGDVVARFEAEEAEKARDQSRFEVEKSRLSESEEEARSAGSLANLGRDAELARWEADLASRYSSRDPEIFSRREIIESQIDRDLADHKKEHAESLQKTEGERSRLDRELLALERAKNEKILERAESSLSALALTAPQGGIFSLKRSYRGQLPRVGDTVWGSQPLAEIPDLAEMEAEVYVLEADAGRLAVGKRAIVRLESDPERPIAGTILRVGTLAEPIAFDSPVQYFSVVVKLAETDPARMRPGQRVRAELILGELDSALTVPLQALFDEDGKKVVLKRQGGAFVPTPVGLGEIAGGRAVVTAGLAAGDLVALLDPRAPARKAPTADEGSRGAAPEAPRSRMRRIRVG